LIYQKIIRPLLFRLPPERVHRGTLGLLAAVGGIKLSASLIESAFHPRTQTPVTVFGLTFNNQVGLAAGYDKDALAISGLAALGFGHIEVGTVTPEPQTGNPGPRVFRLPQDEAIINWMGFPSHGAQAVARRLSRLDKPDDLILGVNLGKNKATPLETAHRDYQVLVDTFAPLADYLAINISSPNTVGLRELQHREFLAGLLEKITESRSRQQEKLGKRVPLLVKLAPDLDDHELAQMIDACLGHQIDGVIATNTTIARENLSSKSRLETGGLSGKPLQERSTEVIRLISNQAGDTLPIIGVGGIANPEDAAEKLEAGASLVQLFTGMIYNGPGIIKKIIENIGQS
jgi:dihydroorotate dehydrogenase